jgi:hypothetical protein
VPVSIIRTESEEEIRVISPELDVKQIAQAIVRKGLKLDAKGACAENRSLAVAKLALVEEKLLDLAKLRDVLRGLVAACDQSHGASCPIIEQLESEIA